MNNVLKGLVIGGIAISGVMMSETTEVSACTYPEAKVTASVLNLRAGRGTNTAVIGKLKQGTTINVLELNSTNGWIKVSIGHKVGYVADDYIRVTNPSHGSCDVPSYSNDDNEYDYIYGDDHLNNDNQVITEFKGRTSANLNFRKSPEVNSTNKIGLIRNFTTVKVVGVSNDGGWYRVIHLGQEGWVSAQYVNKI